MIATCHFFESPRSVEIQTLNDDSNDQDLSHIALSHTRLKFQTSFDTSIRYRDLLELPSIAESKGRLLYALLHIDSKQTITVSKIPDPVRLGCHLSYRLSFLGSSISALLIVHSLPRG